MDPGCGLASLWGDGSWSAGDQEPEGSETSRDQSSGRPGGEREQGKQDAKEVRPCVRDKSSGRGPQDLTVIAVAAWEESWDHQPSGRRTTQVGGDKAECQLRHPLEGWDDRGSLQP